jgi:CRISPR/Cas system Type II protein with McrA/HNH and RuvC-like nuclease domain
MAAAERKPLSKKARFDVFKRDNFRCQYCGQTPPVVVLEVDHITPVAEGGTNSVDNLICSCFDCNRGKGATPLDVVLLTVVEKTARAIEAEEQLKAYQRVMRAKRKRIEKGSWEVAELFQPKASQGFSKAKLTSIRHFIEKLGLEEVIDSMNVALWRKPGANQATFQYFCGVCWNKIKAEA